MIFNSLEFAIFLPIVFLLYWFVLNKNLKLQNLFIVIVSYIFYGWWDWRFLFLIAFSSLVDFFIGVQLSKTDTPKLRKLLMGISLSVNLGFLGFFKYFNFFIDSFASTFTFFGIPFSPTHLNILLPVGISFYTFQTLSYSIDVYRRQLEPTKDIIAFLAFVSFFPQLVAGPIERATHLLPQFNKKREFNYALSVDGLKQILWGLAKKIIIADNAAEFANLIFNNADQYPGSVKLIGAIFFSLQIYGDFSGYSDIAIGTSKLFGFDLMQNFAFPYFSRDIAEFWRRWHISLNTWFRDYLYIPLGGSRGGLSKKVRNTFIIFLVSGFWHGANWTFIVWGGLNALYFLPLLLAKKNRNNIGVVAEDRVFPNAQEVFQMLRTYLLVVLAWIFFRAESVPHAISFIDGIFSTSFFTFPSATYFAGQNLSIYTMVACIIVFFVIEWAGRRNIYAIQHFNLGHVTVKWSFYYSLIFCIFLFMGNEQDFIYFQF
ncbi:MBOAT family O-acyltransferase [Flammeovirga agarivorans]|uniref:MBOAT family protein n=1 Tax=Flammeovirga agarivorans TaxID=2726742 RepID=A0A7X8SHZ3_9BACT|nr:MBOAT family protein [Flammeovirga agarivorans]NLR90472.1 MBOAT family protein [Flammeovirga agarivorans]